MKDAKAVVHFAPVRPDLSLMLPIILTDEEAARIVMPPQSTYRAEVRERGRIVVPKSIRESLGLSAGDEVDVIVVPVKKGDPDE